MALLEHGSTQERDLSWLDNPYGPRLSRDGSEVLFTDQSEDGGHDYAVYVRKSDGSPTVRIGGGGFGTDLSPDGQWALISLPGDPARRVQIVPTGPGQARVFHWDGIEPLWANWFSGWTAYPSEGHPVGTRRGGVHYGCERLDAETSVA